MPTDTNPPKQNTDEIGKKTYPVTDFHQDCSTAAVKYTQATLAATKGFIMADFAINFLTNKKLVLEVMSDGYLKIKPGLPPEEYSLLVGSRNWNSISGKYESEKYLVYDNTQEKDPNTQLYPEFYLMFRESPYIKVSFDTAEDDDNPILVFDFKSSKEYSSK